MNKEDFSESLFAKKSVILMTLDQKKLDINFVTLQKKNIENFALDLNQYLESLKPKN